MNNISNSNLHPNSTLKPEQHQYLEDSFDINDEYESVAGYQHVPIPNPIPRHTMTNSPAHGNVSLYDRLHDYSTGQVTSRGCSRVYIVFVLYRALFYVQQLRTEHMAVFFPFPTPHIESWFEMAQQDCTKSRYNEYNILLGGTVFTLDDTSTYWTNPQQFFTW